MNAISRFLAKLGNFKRPGTLAAEAPPLADSEPGVAAELPQAPAVTSDAAPEGRVDAETRNRIASELWKERAEALVTATKPLAWSDSLLVHEMYIQPLLSGDTGLGWMEYVAFRYFPKPVDIALSLGCGGGALERHGLLLKIARRFKGIDVSEGALELARKLSREAGCQGLIDYETADLNALILPENAYDAVMASQSVHHIEALEHYLDQVVKTLKPGGLFIVNEFVGPNQFQWRPAQVAHAQRLLDTLPKKYRGSLRGNGEKQTINCPTIAAMNEVDPTEAIRSDDILAEMSKRFDIVERRDFGGTLLQLVLDDIAGNFEDNPEDRAVLQTLFDEEHRLISSGELTSDFTLVIARNRKS